MRKILFGILFVLLMSQVVFAVQLSRDAITTQDALILAHGTITEMIKAGFNTARVNDTYILAKDEFDSKVILEGRGQDVSYTTIIVKLDTITAVRNEAFMVNDEMVALQIIIEPLDREELPETFVLYDKAIYEFNSERYETCLELINQVYDKMGEEQSSQATLFVFYESTSKTIKGFLLNYWKEILYTIAAIIIIGIVTYRRFSVYITENKIKDLEIKKEVLKTLIRDAQKEYFEKNKMSETEYHIKIAKFSEMIRDIERQIPLLKEVLAKEKKIKVLNK
ncbi:MAG: hypothetical protein KJ906_03305 [Nanoarchaeota archaeon]|nr:hypothetical protein [Nanoarchaeota archaeon]